MVALEKLEEYSRVQGIARAVMELARDSLHPGQTLIELRALCEKTMLDLGADSFWYWGIGAFVFAGEETTKSVSGREYQLSNYALKSNDIVTIDLSPQVDGTWGDFARTLVIEDGVPLLDSRKTNNLKWREGIEAEYKLHQKLVEVARPEMSFEQLAAEMNSQIDALGFSNRDFLGNLGHSIERQSADRIYLEQGNQALLRDVDFFTFEPHICLPEGSFGYKHENIYYFRNGTLEAL